MCQLAVVGRAGTIEILSSMKVITTGERVPASAAALLSKLNIKPFAYGIEITKVLFLSHPHFFSCRHFASHRCEAMRGVGNVSQRWESEGHPQHARICLLVHERMHGVQVYDGGDFFAAAVLDIQVWFLQLDRKTQGLQNLGFLEVNSKNPRFCR